MEWRIRKDSRTGEYIADYGPEAEVIVPADNKEGYEVVSIWDLIPNKYKKRIDSCK